MKNNSTILLFFFFLFLIPVIRLHAQQKICDSLIKKFPRSNTGEIALIPDKIYAESYKAYNVHEELEENEIIEHMNLLRRVKKIYTWIIISVVVVSGILLDYYIKRTKYLKKLLIKNMKEMKEERMKKLKQPNTSKGRNIPQSGEAKPKYKNSKLTDASRELLENKLEQLIENQNLWRISDITVEKIATMLNTNSKYISQIINQKYKQSFPNFINGFRVKEARSMLLSKNYTHYSIDGIGKLCGFKSNSSFVAAFRKYTGLTPSYFRDPQKKLLS